jgi:hypothetical protein
LPNFDLVELLLTDSDGEPIPHAHGDLEILGTLETDEMPTYSLARFTITDRTGQPIANARVTVKALDANGKPSESSHVTDANGQCNVAVQPQKLPLAPMLADYNVRTAEGTQASGKVKCGGNEETPLTQVVINN